MTSKTPTAVDISKIDFDDLKRRSSENRSSLSFPTEIGSVAIRPEDMGKVKSKALTAMREQTSDQYERLKKRMQAIIDEANEIQNRVMISEKIYTAKMSFEPLMGKSYYLYEDSEGKTVLSLISPSEWADNCPFEKYHAQVQLLHDHTWKIIDDNL